MKVLKPLALAVIMFEIIVTHYEMFFTGDSSSSGLPNPNHIFWKLSIISQLAFYTREFFPLAYLITTIIYFVSTNSRLQNKAYSIFRYLFIIQFIFNLPTFLSHGLSGLKFETLKQRIEIIQIPVRFAVFFILLFNKPINQPKAINLQDYTTHIPASRWSRLLTHLLDMLFCFTVTKLWYLTLNNVYSVSLETALLLLSFTLLYFAYFFLSEALFSQTFGKLLTGSIVAGVSSKMGPGKAALRSLFRLIPFERYSFLIGKDWHDKLSGTTVVYINSLKEDFFPDESK
ncbi:RDD family protein [Pseudoflavitalea sp. G-6-1-2]|uniref:RDD family protein n=1 Tax=Pseudoflavitalea sp. G-6-1-2 TaxID=2728841 RepID=UPI00146EA8A3|nr:RDD family protein [Pseudoflavitalea sp. G-6-1-2]NML19813.1 RDD family protein [Pseudoflavitalea sp. G-6-1-2]